MILGVDFDNTIVCHDVLFFEVARQRGLLADGVPRSKHAVRQHVLNAFSNTEWTLLQAEVYGPRLREAPSYPGVVEFFARCTARGLPIYIVSHKTRRAVLGAPYDLRQAALDWLDQQGFFSRRDVRFDRERVLFADTRAEKLARIGSLGCSSFIDDLPEVLDEPGFPPGVTKILFDPDDTHVAWRDGIRARAWADIERLF